MDRIIFDNVQRGFPANERFMKVVDSNTASIINVCAALFGNTPTIVSGLQVEQRMMQGVLRVGVHNGFMWTGYDLIYVEGGEFTGADPDKDLYLLISGTTEKGTFHDGTQYNAYYITKGNVVDAKATLVNNSSKLSALPRAGTLRQFVSTKIIAADLDKAGNNVNGTLQQTTYYDGRVNLCGTIAVLNIPTNEDLYKRGLRVARLLTRNADIDKDISSGKNRQGNAYPAAVTFETGRGWSDERMVSFAHFVKMTDEGEIYIYIPYDKLPSSVIATMTYLDVYVSVDFTFNSK